MAHTDKIFVAEDNTPNVVSIDEDSLGYNDDTGTSLDTRAASLSTNVGKPESNFWEECVNLKEAKS